MLVVIFLCVFLMVSQLFIFLVSWKNMGCGKKELLSNYQKQQGAKPFELECKSVDIMRGNFSECLIDGGDLCTAIGKCNMTLTTEEPIIRLSPPNNKIKTFGVAVASNVTINNRFQK